METFIVWALWSKFGFPFCPTAIWCLLLQRNMNILQKTHIPYYVTACEWNTDIDIAIHRKQLYILVAHFPLHEFQFWITDCPWSEKTTEQYRLHTKYAKSTSHTWAHTTCKSYILTFHAFACANSEVAATATQYSWLVCTRNISLVCFCYMLLAMLQINDMKYSSISHIWICTCLQLQFLAAADNGNH